MDDKSFNIRVPKKWARAGMIAVVTALIVAPLTAWAAHSFNDVPNSNTFHEDIAWLKDAGVTLGCNPPANTLFCPKDNVTREQMSAFMRRLAENKVVDAATAVQADHATTADSATTAGNADTLDGQDSSAFASADTVPGVAFAFDAAGGTTAGTESVIALTITAPAAGYVLVEGSIEVAASGLATAVSSVANGFDAVGADGPLKNTTGITGRVIMTEEKVYQVAAGSHTYYITIEGSGRAWDDATLVATYYPTAYGPVPDAVVTGSVASGSGAEG